MGELVDVVREGPIARVVMHRSGNNAIAPDLTAELRAVFEALGGSCELALCCDYRVMVEDGRSRIGQTESALGIIPGAGGTQRLGRLIGKARALPLLFESVRLSAGEAAALGLVNRAVAPEELDAAVDELAARLARSATLA